MKKRFIKNCFAPIKKLLSSGRSESLLEQYKLMAEHLTASVIIKNASGEVLYCSPFTQTLTGRPLNDFYSSKDSFLALIVDKGDRDVYKRASKITALGEAFQFCYRILHAGGFELWVETRSTPILDKQGNVEATVSITTDVTRRVRFQKQVEEKNSDLHDLTYMISHDLKGPIFTIKGMLSIVKDDHEEEITPGLKEVFDHISDAQQRLESLVVDVLEYANAGAEANQIEPVDLHALVSDIFQECAISFRMKDAKLELKNTLPTIECDRIKLYQIFANLISNAFKYKSAQPLELKAVSQQSTDGRFITISLIDNGTGIAEENQKTIFRPFHRASEAHSDRSSGVGLACVAKILEKLNGKISLESEPGKGSNFLVTLPARPSGGHL